MAAPQRQLQPAPRVGEAAPKRATGGGDRRRSNLERRRFAVLVVVPVVLMLGSIYLHTVAADLGGKTGALQEERATLLVEKERLEVEVADLSAPGRVRSLARQNLGMKAPAAEDMITYDVEDGKENAGQEVQEGAR
ncbi:MAG: hypothetical protein ACFB50_09005 [Rubrobacteraceae bacterium]